MAEQQRDDRRRHRDEQPGTEHHPRPPARQPADVGETAADVAQGDRRAGHDPADEAAAGLVVPGEEQPQRTDHDGREHDADRHLDGDQAGHHDARRPTFTRLGDPPGPASGSRQGDGADGGGGEHRHLAERVEAADVDEDHVDDVAAAAFGVRLGDHRVGHVGHREDASGRQGEHEHEPADDGRRWRCGRPAGRRRVSSRTGRAVGAARARTAPSTASRWRPGSAPGRGRPGRRTARPSSSRPSRGTAHPRSAGGRSPRRGPARSAARRSGRAPTPPRAAASPATTGPLSSSTPGTTAAVRRMTPV